jgi:hypothetical protein
MSLVHKNISANVGLNIKSSISSGISNLNSVFSSLGQESKVHPINIRFDLDIINWFSIFFSSGVFTNFSVAFQATRSVFGNQYNSNQDPQQAMFIFIAFIMDIIGSGFSSSAQVIQKLNRFGVSSKSGFINLDLFSSFITRFWVNFEVFGVFPLIFSHSIGLTVSAVSVDYQIQDIYNSKSLLWKNCDPIFVKGITNKLIPVSQASNLFPGGIIPSTSLFTIFDSGKARHNISLWHMFVNHNDSPLSVELLDDYWLNDHVDCSALLAGTVLPFIIDNEVQSFSGLLSNVNNINPVTTCFCMQLLNCSIQITSVCSYFNVISIYSPLLSGSSTHIGSYSIDSDILGSILGFYKEEPIRSKAAQERSAKKVKRALKPAAKAANKHSPKETLDAKPDSVTTIDISKVDNLLSDFRSNPSLNKLEDSELVFIVKSILERLLGRQSPELIALLQ